MMTDLSKKNSDTLGNPAIVPDDGNDYLHNQRIGLIQIHNDSFVKDYIYLLLCTKEYHEAVVATAAGSTVKHTSPKRIYSINLIVSTSKEEQSAIANVLSSMDKEIETLNTKTRKKYRNLKTAMMQQLLTGKIRLR
ncbi:MAG: restriction endonuclease subunit S [Treponema succinifaciens]|nr:MAG: restriction endonuclease subunit S [Treponema succinifaciens]